MAVANNTEKLSHFNLNQLFVIVYDLMHCWQLLTFFYIPSQTASLFYIYVSYFFMKKGNFINRSSTVKHRIKRRFTQLLTMHQYVMHVRGTSLDETLSRSIVYFKIF